MAGRKIRDERDARECLDAVEQSGMERAAWARANGIDGRSLNAWRLNLQRLQPEIDALRIVELIPQGQTRETTFRVGCGPFIVEVPPDFDDNALARLLGVVAAC